jgi:hypothetical protein
VNIFGHDAAPMSHDLVVEHATPAVAVTELLRGTELPAQAHVALVADAGVMPAADIAASPEAVAVEASPHGEVARVLAEALSGGGDNPIDALLDTLPGNAHSAAAASIAGGWDAGQIAALLWPSHTVFSVEVLAIHVDATPVA